MPINFDTTFEPFKGQSRAQRLSDGRVIKATRAGNQGTPAKDAGALYPYMPKCTQMLFDMPKLQTNPFERITSIYGAEYGNYIELGAIGDPNFAPDANPPVGSAGATIPNRGMSDACMVYDRIKYTANYLFQNIYTHAAYIDQREGRKGFVNNANADAQLAGLTAQAMAQELSVKRKAIMTRLFCDCVDGEVPAYVDGNTKSDGTGDTVAEAKLVLDGWAGKVNLELDEEYIPSLTEGEKATGITPANALAFADEIRAALTYGKYLSNYYVPGGYRLDKFTTPVLVIEEPILDALERAFAIGDVGGGVLEVPRNFNNGWWAYVSKGKSIGILTTDRFEEIPQGGTGDGLRMLGALVEPDMFKNFVYQDDMDSDKCLQPRGMVYDYQRVEALGVDVRRPSCVFLCNNTEPAGAE